MTDTAIKIENISKSYRLGLTHSGSVRESVNRLAAKLARRPAPPAVSVPEADSKRVDENGLFWALRDISLEINVGEVVGLIGTNGAGKSTLLKMLSRITAPTSGCIEIRGRTGSLLEVGTGFHPELTGRENVFLNGTILGMTKSEVARQFDAIVAFGGVEQFIDTPVKRYSSGMLVRLGFSVAAHLEPEILIIDEVLAVGDSAFQRKCVDKIAEIQASGRTILFVSHNMALVRTLCSRCVLLHDGKVQADGSAEEISREYERIDGKVVDAPSYRRETAPENNNATWIREIDVLCDRSPNSSLELGGNLSFRIQCEHASPSARSGESSDDIYIGFIIYDAIGQPIINANNRYQGENRVSRQGKATTIDIDLGSVPLMPGRHQVSFWVGDRLRDTDGVNHAVSFTVVPRDYWGTGLLPPPSCSAMWWPTSFSNTP